jgi:AcrR family transcriptional regulator
MEAVVEGLRQRKKRKTREAIVDAAMSLFEEKGFGATTIADIADRAEIAPRTFFAYFPSKEDVVFSDFSEALGSMESRFATRAPGEDAIDALRGWIAGMVEQMDSGDKRKECQHRLIRENADLADHDRALRGHFEEELVRALREDFSDRGDRDVRARMVAAAAVSALAALDDDHGASGKRDDEDPMAIVDEALAFVRGGIAALEAR